MSQQDYFARFGFCPRQIESDPHPDLGLVVVVPCHNEPRLLDTLEALWRCQRPQGAVEVIVVVNGSMADTIEVRAQNDLSMQESHAWSKLHDEPRWKCYTLCFPNLPPRRAGVGLARKIGMDEALRRLSAGRPGRAGIIANLDADCLCDANYLLSVEQHFASSPLTPACSIYFEHPLEGPEPAAVYEAAALYELHLRYYVQALRWAGWPYAFHTIGSSMAVRAQVYQAQGGMNSRQAGEDFYFLHKIIPLGHFTDLVSTRVIPSPRASDRVPFGTGRAVGDFLAGKAIATYPHAAFVDLARLVERLRNFPAPGTAGAFVEALPQTVRTFLEVQEFSQAWAQAQKHTSQEATFRRRLFGWLDGFRVMKFIHHARDHFYGAADVRSEARRLLAEIKGTQTDIPALDVRGLLTHYRVLDRGSEAAKTRSVSLADRLPEGTD